MASSNDSVYAQAHNPALPPEIATNEKNGQNNDLISSLPDCVLSMIISLLSTKEGARTTILSSRWRRLWASAPLNFDSCDLSVRNTRLSCSQNSCAVKDVVSEILNRHHGSVRRFCLSHLCYEGRETCLNEWIRDLSTKSVQEITVKIVPPCNQLPTSLLMCKCLQSLKLHWSWFPNTNESNPCFTGLSELVLSYSVISEKDLKSVLSCCQALQSLSLIGMNVNNSDWVPEIEICSSSLESLLVKDCLLKKICIKDAPKLKRLILRWMKLGPRMPEGACVEVVHAPKMEVLGYLVMGFTKFEMGSTLLKGSHLSVSTLIYSVKTLAISVVFDTISQATVALEFLRCLPLLETLHVQFLPTPIGPTESPGLQYSNFQDSINCLENHVKSVTFQSYKGDSIELDFAMFLLSRAKALKVLKVVPGRDELMAKIQTDILCMRNEVPSDAQIILVTKCSFGGGLSADGTNLSVQDPFDYLKGEENLEIPKSGTDEQIELYMWLRAMTLNNPFFQAQAH